MYEELLTLKKSMLIFDIRQNLFFKKIQIWKIQVRWNKDILEEIMDYFFIKMHWRHFKYHNLLHRLNIYKFPRKEHQVVDFWVSDQLAAWKILFRKYLEYVPLIKHNYKKLKMPKFLWFTICSIFNGQ